MWVGNCRTQLRFYVLSFTILKESEGKDPFFARSLLGGEVKDTGNEFEIWSEEEGILSTHFGHMKSANARSSPGQELVKLADDVKQKKQKSQGTIK